MRRQNLALWCCTLLLVASSELRGNSMTTIDNERNNSIGRYESHADVIMTNRSDDAELIRYKVHENSTKNNDDVQYEFHANSTRNNREDNDSVQHEFRAHSTKDHEGGNQMPMELGANSTKVDDKNNSTSHELHGNSTQIEDRSNLTLYEVEKFYEDDNKKSAIPCENSICIPLCCPYGSRLKMKKCSAAESGNYLFPDVYKHATNNSLERKRIDQKLDELFSLIYNPCLSHQGRYVLDPERFQQDDYMFLINGSLYQPSIDTFVESYCLALLKQNTYQVAICFNKTVLDEQDKYQQTLYPIGLVVSLPFLLTTFVVYSILPELWNMHGYTLRAYIGSMFIAYTFLAIIQLFQPATIPDSVCVALAFITYFSFLASFFWLNVMCFDIWWTFGGFRSLQRSVKQRERKKFVMYSIYAWGSASLLSIICAIMDFVPNVPRELIRPEFGERKCWFNTNEARGLYFYGPMSVTIFCNICLFISTALKIVRHKKDTVHHLRGSESQRHDDNKQWFNLYLKLFIMMGINWSMEIISWLIPHAPTYIWYLSDLTNTLQGLIIFIIFVWKEKIKRLLLKRFGCQNCGLFSRNSTHSGCHSSASRTCTTTSGVMSLQEKVNSYVQTNCRAKNSSDEADP